MTTARAGRGRGRGIPAGLSTERVIEAAERVVDRGGFEALSLRHVATELGVSPTAIYNHVRDRSALIDAVADAFVAREMVADLPTDATPVEVVREAARRVHRAGCRHPELLLSIAGHRPEADRTAQHLFGELILENLLAAGASEERAQDLYRTIVALAAGAAIAHRNLSRPSSTPTSLRREQQRAASSRPAAARLLHELPAPCDEAAYDRQLDLVLDGLRQEHDERTR
ncbi:TetR/AcrR family transcriptional regulator [Microbacterium paraoxydans]|uniref:TetR/AcrR family transcriptional regulator n=1 Tax=Microbacterium paraoxydans TaxID=199592 RepID=UPI001CFAC0B2|nr:TetR/AcrR family transcriptional regulator [Microbacterium paraoxydans]